MKIFRPLCRNCWCCMDRSSYRTDVVPLPIPCHYHDTDIKMEATHFFATAQFDISITSFTSRDGSIPRWKVATYYSSAWMSKISSPSKYHVHPAAGGNNWWHSYRGSVPENLCVGSGDGTCECYFGFTGIWVAQQRQHTCTSNFHPFNI